MQSFLVILLLLIAQSAFGQATYVKKTGSNANSCAQALNPATPKLTINAAFSCLNGSRHAAAGKSIEIGNGVYVEALDANVNAWPTGNLGNPFTLRSIPGEQAILKNTGELNIRLCCTGGEIDDHVVIADITIDNSNLTSNACAVCLSTNYVTIEDSRLLNTNNTTNVLTNTVNFLTIQRNFFSDGTFSCIIFANCPGGTQGYHIYLTASNSIVDSNIFEKFPAWGIHSYCNGCGPNSNNTISRNTLRFFGQQNTGIGGPGDGRESAILVNQGSGHKVFANVIHHGTACIGMGQSAVAALHDNTCDNMKGHNIPTFSGLTVNPTTSASNNAISNISGSAIITDPGLGTSIPATVTRNLGPADQTGISVVTSTPRYADVLSGDYRPCTAVGVPHARCPGASVMLGEGTNLGAPYNTAIDGTTRPGSGAWTIGAYEAIAPTCPSTPALVAQYGFDGNTVDSSGNSNNGSLGSGVTFAAGRYGQAASFNGTGSISVANAPNLWLCNGYTVGAWIKPSNTPTDFATLVSKRETGTGQGLFVYTASHPFYCGASGPLAGYTQGGVNAFNCYATAFTQDVFTHVAETWDGTTLRKYVNGSLVTSATATAVLDSNVAPLQIGGSVFGEYLQGLVDEVRIHNYARSGAQIISDMNTPIGALTAPVSLRLSGGSTIKLAPGATLRMGNH